RGGGSGGRRAAHCVAVLCRGRALLVVLLLGPADRRVLDAAEDSLAEQVVVRAGVLELARRVGGRCGAPCRGATRRRDGLAVLGVLVVDRRDLRHRRLELVLRRAARGIVLRVGGRDRGRRRGGGRRCRCGRRPRRDRCAGRCRGSIGGRLDGRLGRCRGSIGGRLDGRLGRCRGSIGGRLDGRLGRCRGSIGGGLDGRLGRCRGSIGGGLDGRLGRCRGSIGGGPVLLGAAGPPVEERGAHEAALAPGRGRGPAAARGGGGFR